MGMISIIKAEFLKQNRTFGGKIIWLAPVTTLVLAFVMVAGMKNAYAESAWNWWYVMLLPGALAILCGLTIAKEKKIKYFYQLTLPLDKRRLMLGKMCYLILTLFVANVVLAVGATLGGSVLTTSVPVFGAIPAVVVLTITYLWEIPVFLFLSIRFGMFVTVLTGVLLAVIGTGMASSGNWWMFAPAIPIRVVCPLLHVLPNGLRAEAGDALLDAGVLLPGIILSLFWFVVATVLFLKWFERKEVR